MDLAERRERVRQSPHFQRGVFVNTVDTHIMRPRQALSVGWRFLTRRAARRPPGPLPALAPGRADFADPPVDGVRACWLGHSTVLLEVEGVRLLCDPVWGRRSSPVAAVGPARFQPVPLPLEELPAIDVVLISHDHYDHLDRPTIRRLAGLFPEAIFVTPLAVGAHLCGWGVAPGRVHELDWWDELPVAGGRLRVTAAPARHFSGRGLADRNRTQWAAYAIRGAARRVFFGGDGGHSPDFAEIGARLGPFDLALLEIGAFNEAWGQVHLGPEKALVASRELGGRALLPIHWGTFNLGLHDWDEPIETLVAAAPAAGVELIAPRLGELVRLAAPPKVEPWWREVART